MTATKAVTMQIKRVIVEGGSLDNFASDGQIHQTRIHIKVR